MKEILEPLALIPGVRMAALISEDGVPIVTTRGAHSTEDAEGSIDHDEVLNSFTALAAGWLGEVTRAVGQLSWPAPRRISLRATHGELVLQHAPGAVVLVVLEHGVTAEELRVPMEGAVARMSRVLRALNHSREETNSSSHPTQAPGLLQAAHGQHLPAATSNNSTENHGSDNPGAH